jgi:predicted DCC family thiol-disulfide oxidoreductase YuxK
MTLKYVVIYDGRCNLCSSLVQGLGRFDQGALFQYIPMQDEAALAQWHVTAADCEMGMILIQADQPERRWQGSDAAEEITRLLPAGRLLVEAYRALPGLKGMGDRIYEQVRDHRYEWFGRREKTYQSSYPEASCTACDHASVNEDRH